MAASLEAGEGNVLSLRPGLYSQTDTYTDSCEHHVVLFIVLFGMSPEDRFHTCAEDQRLQDQREVAALTGRDKTAGLQKMGDTRKTAETLNVRPFDEIYCTWTLVH